MSVLLWFAGLAKGLWTRLLAPIGRWLLADWRNGPLAMLLLCVLAHQFLIDPRLRAERETARAGHRQVQQVLDQTVETYRKAQLAAAEAATANRRRVEGEQARISKEIAGDYETRIAAARARAADLAEQLRGAGTRTPAGAALAVPVPGIPAAAGGAAEAPGDDGFPAPGTAPLTLEERLIATEQAIQLDALISWVERQAGVPVNPGGTE